MPALCPIFGGICSISWLHSHSTPIYSIYMYTYMCVMTFVEVRNFNSLKGIE